ncbi:transposase [Acetobacter fabarum]|nr:transposase [Acetobacter fabarum]
MIDSMIVRAPACRWRTHRQRRADTQGLGRSRSGLSSKVHLAADALSNPVRMTFTGGQRNDITQAHDLIEGFDPDAVIADKGYDTDHLRDAVEDAGGEPVIPPKSNRKTPKNYDRALWLCCTIPAIGRAAIFEGFSDATGCVRGIPRAVKRLRTAIRTRCRRVETQEWR